MKADKLHRMAPDCEGDFGAIGRSLYYSIEALVRVLLARFSNRADFG